MTVVISTANENRLQKSLLMTGKVFLTTKIIKYCYIDTSLLMEKIPLGKFIRIKTISGTRVAYFPYPHW